MSGELRKTATGRGNGKDIGNDFEKYTEFEKKIRKAELDKSIYLGHYGNDSILGTYCTDPTVKIGVIRGHVSGEPNAGDAAVSYAAMNTLGYVDGKYCINFETKNENLPNSVERMRIDGNGNVGIGTSHPGNMLEIKNSGNTTPGIIIDNGTGRYQLGTGIINANDGKFGIYDYKGGSNRFVLDENGNVGIGTLNPGNMLEIKNNGSRTPGIIIDNGTGRYQLGTGIISANDGKFGIYDYKGGSNRFVLDENGNVGIGKTDPKYTLDVQGTINASVDVIIAGADCAEDFDIVGAESIEPGAVMVIDNSGALRASEQAYDKRVAGVISGAGDFRPGITLGRQIERSNRLPIALNGKVYCKVDAEYTPVEVGDLLTTSSTVGHAMKADDRDKAFGAVIGKALHELEDGRGLIPILVALQ